MCLIGFSIAMLIFRGRLFKLFTAAGRCSPKRESYNLYYFRMAYLITQVISRPVEDHVGNKFLFNLT